MTKNYRVECATCGWVNVSRDWIWTQNAGVIHVKMMQPGHVLKVSP